MKRLFIIIISIAFFSACQTAQAPEPFGAVPSQRQMLWHQMEYHAFIHFGPNTFTEKEWGHGDESPDDFNPSRLDCRQWVKVLKDAGFEGVVFTAKHHDGFCLWPSQYSKHTVRESSWREGKGDVLREMADACAEFGMKLGIYLSPWDRNHPAYFTPEYNDTYKAMLEEVLTNYGPIYYVFLDGAFSVGPDGKRQEYDWQGFHQVIRRCQPDAVVFSDGGPDVRWLGNERGFADETNWCTVKKDFFYPGIPNVNEQLLKGHEDGQQWLPAEADVSIRPGWFYHKSEDAKVKSLKELVDIWFNSVGRNANLLLNVPPDQRGLISDFDIQRLMEFKRWREKAFNVDLAQGADVTATNTRGVGFEPENVLDGSENKYWATADDISRADLQIEFAEERGINAILLREYIPLGQRVKGFVVKALLGDEFQVVARGTTIGNRRIVTFENIKTKKVIVTIDAKAAILLSSVKLYSCPPVE